MAQHVDDLTGIEPIDELRDGSPLDVANQRRVAPIRDLRRLEDQPSGAEQELERAAKSGFVGRNAKQLLVAADFLAISIGFALALIFAPSSNFSSYVTISVLAPIIGPFIMASRRLYKSRFITRHTDEIRFVLHAIGFGAVFIVFTGFIFNTEISRGWFFAALGFTTAAVLIEREVARILFKRARRSGRQARPVLIVGYNGEADRLSNTLADEPEHGYQVVGFIDSRPAADGRSVFERTMDAVDESGATGVIIATTAVDMSSANRLVRSLSDAQIHVELSSSLVDIAPERLFVRPVGRFPTLYVEPAPRHGWRATAKRAFDIFVAVGLLAVTLPVTIGSAIAVKMTSDGPLFFAQTRVGKGGEKFPVYKFRTMVVNAEELQAELQAANEADGPLFKMTDDPRITKIGGLLRKFSIDELPQLWNVLRGDMSIVGPRPALPAEMAEWEPEYHERLAVRPGITGMWQVSGRSDTSFEDYIRLDLYYVHNWSLVTDMSIMAKTVPAVLFARGAR